MTTYNTGNPIGSTDSRDRLDNTENMDYLENSTTELTHADRLGTVRKTRHGMEVEHDAQIAAHETEHDAQMQSFENDFDGRLAGMAFTRVGSFATGATLTDMRQVLVWEVSQGGDGHEYGWAGTFPKVVAAGATPATSGGVGAGAWVDRTENRLRSDLNVVVKTFNSVADMVADASLIVGQKCRTLGYYAVGDGGGNDYEIVAAATGTDDGGSYIDLSGSGFQAKHNFNGDIDVRKFGVVIDPGEYSDYASASELTDNTTALLNIRDYLLLNNNAHHVILFSAGICSYKSGQWLRGVRSYDVVGSGTQLINTLGGLTSLSYTMTLNNGAFTDYDVSGNASAVDKLGELIHSTNDGSIYVTLVTASDAEKFLPGYNVLVYGLNIYNGGFPPSARFFEWNEVVNSDNITGVVTLKNKLKFSYNEEWTDSSNPAAPIGAPRIKVLNGDGFEVTERASFENIEFLGVDNTSPYTRDKGILFTTGAINFSAKNCKMDSFVPTVCDMAEIYSCEISQSAEVDKLISSVKFVNSKINSVTQGTGCHSFIAIDTKITGDSYIRSKDKYIERCEIDAQTVLSGNQVGFPAYEHMIGRFVFKDNVINTDNLLDYKDNQVLYNGIFSTKGITVFSSSGSPTTSITVSSASFTAEQRIIEGARFKVKSSSIYGQFKKIRSKSGDYITIDIDCTGVINASDVIHSQNFEMLSISGNRVSDSGGDSKILVPFSQPLILDSNNSHSYTMVFDLYNQTQISTPTLGVISKIEVNVLKAYTGPDITPQLRLEAINNSGYPNQVINITQAGLRVMDINGFVGNKTGDTISALPYAETIGSRFIIKGDAGYSLLGGNKSSVSPDKSQMPVITAKFYIDPIKINW